MLEAMTLVNFVPSLGGETTLPLGVLYLASVLEQAGCEVEVSDYQLAPYERPLSQDSILDFLAGSRPTLGISCLFNTLPFLLPCLQQVKAANPDNTIILGGAGPSSVAEKLMQRFPFIDVIVRGEGERTVLDLARGLPYADIAGIVYRSDGQVIVNPPRERISQLDDLPLPAYHQVPFADYLQNGIITARGCPYHCTFCEVAALWGHHTERRSVANVVAEIKFLHERYGVRSLHINDDTFVLDKRWVLDFCDALEAQDLGVTWRCLGRINLMDKNLLARMSETGCVGIQYGVESGSEHVLEQVSKQISIAQVQDVIKMSVDYIAHVICTFMWGFPFESMEDFYETIYLMGLVVEMGSSVKLLMLSPSPLSPIYRQYQRQLAFSEELVSNLLWGVLGDTLSPAEKAQAVATVIENPDIFPGFFYIDTPDILKKYHLLQKSGFIETRP